MKINIRFLTVFLLWSGIAQSQVQFSQLSWPQALEQAKNESRYIFVDAFTDWCVWCKEMDRRTFSNKEAGDFMNPGFIALKMDMEKDTGVTFAMKYRVTGFPTFLIFSPEGRLVYVMRGFMEAEPFIAGLQKSMEGERRTGFPGISDKLELDFPAFYVQSFKGNPAGKVVKADSAVIANYLHSGKDLFSEVNWSVLTRFMGNQPWSQEFILSNREKYSALFGKEEVDDVVQTIISKRILASIKSRDEKQFEQSLSLVDKYLEDPDGKTKRYYRITYYQETAQWIKMDKMIQELISAEGYVESLNEFAWTIYEKCREPAVIRDAINWMEKLTDKSPTYASLDTYAALLYKDKQYAPALSAAERALSNAMETNQDSKETQALMEKIRKEMK